MGISEIQVTSILANLAVRLAAIAAGTYVVWLGHNTFVRGIKGDFEFDGKWAKLKGSSPGLLFVLLGCLSIGWALQATHQGEVQTTEQVITDEPSSPNVPELPPDSGKLSQQEIGPS